MTPVARDIGSRRELFVDDWLIDRLENARLVLHRPQPRDVASRCDQPWESAGPGYPTVLRDGDRYRMYYIGGMTKGNPIFACGKSF